MILLNLQKSDPELLLKHLSIDFDLSINLKILLDLVSHRISTRHGCTNACLYLPHVNCSGVRTGRHICDFKACRYIAIAASLALIPDPEMMP